MDRLSLSSVADKTLNMSQRDAAERAVTALSTVINKLDSKSDTALLAGALRNEFKKVLSSNCLDPDLFVNGADELHTISSRLSMEIEDLNLQLDMAMLLSEVYKSGLIETPESEIARVEQDRKLVGKWTQVYVHNVPQKNDL